MQLEGKKELFVMGQSRRITVYLSLAIVSGFWVRFPPKKAAWWGQNTCLSIPSGLRTTLRKLIFFIPGTLVDPLSAPAVRGPGCPQGPPSDHPYGRLGGSLGDSEASKPQRVGGYEWTKCPRNQILTHVTQDTARAWFRGVWCTWRRFWGFLAPFLGRFSDISWS